MDILRILTLTAGCLGQRLHSLYPQCSTDGSSFNLTSTQKAAASLSETLANNINIAKRFEESMWANGSVYDDPFYESLPDDTETRKPGSLLYAEKVANTTVYALPPYIGLSRIIYQSETMDGDYVPVSAYVLWPFTAKVSSYAYQPIRPFQKISPCRERRTILINDTRSGNITNIVNHNCAKKGTDEGRKDEDEDDDRDNDSEESGKHVGILAERTRHHMVVWGHDATGVYGECAPSHFRNLDGHFAAPYTLALQGYVVVAPDYAGLGVSHFWNGSLIVHEFLVAPAAGNDLLYAAAAAKEAYQDYLTDEFVVVGLSQGGAGAWAAAQLQTRLNVSGYLGSVAVAPLVDPTSLDGGSVEEAGLMIAMAETLVERIPGFRYVHVLQAAGEMIRQLAREVDFCTPALFTHLSGLVAERYEGGRDLLNRTFFGSPVAHDFRQRAGIIGGRPLGGPLLVLHGTNDTLAKTNATTEAVYRACDNATATSGGIDYVKLDGLGHDGILYASQPIWLDWIAQRFQQANHQHTQHASIDGPQQCTIQTIRPDSRSAVAGWEASLRIMVTSVRDAYLAWL